MSDTLPFSAIVHHDHALADPAPTPFPRITSPLVEMDNGALFVVDGDDILDGAVTNGPLHLTDADIVFHLLFRTHRRNLIHRTKP